MREGRGERSGLEEGREEKRVEATGPGNVHEGGHRGEGSGIGRKRERREGKIEGGDGDEQSKANKLALLKQEFTKKITRRRAPWRPRKAKACQAP